MRYTQTKRGDLEKKRPTFLLIGLVTALAFSYGLLTLEMQNKAEIPVYIAVAAADADDLTIPRTWPEPLAEEVSQEIEDQKQDLQKKIVEVPNHMQLQPINETRGAETEPLAEIPEIKEETMIEVDVFSLEKKPVFPGCEDLPEEKERFACFMQQINKHVVRNLKPCEGAFGVTEEKLFIQFTIDEHGRVTAAKALRGSDECNVSRALSVINALPKMKPGSYRGKTVRTRFVLPINIK
jgi:protein TonB